MTVIRLGVAGIGAAGQEIQAIVRHPGLELAGLADVDRELLAATCRRVGVQGFDSVEALCDGDTVDAVYIGTPTHLHTEHALMAIERDKHVLLAKPMALNLAGAERTIAAAERKRVHLMVGHTQSYEPPVLRMRDIVSSGELGALGMINSWYFTDWIYRGRKPTEMDSNLGGGVVYRQGAHHFDILRLIGGGLVRSVRALAGCWDRERPTEGAYSAFLDFENGVAATAVFNGYDRFRTTELGFPIGEGGSEVTHNHYGAARTALAKGGAGGELDLKKRRRAREVVDRHQSFYGLTIVSCQRGDIRQSPDGLLVYGEEGIREVPLPAGVGGRDIMMDELHQAAGKGRRPSHDGYWGMATLEVQLAVLQSSREGREVLLSHQVPYRGS
jgi:phthalate 4,5-cis-dihydrodiol dehydrogenase